MMVVNISMTCPGKESGSLCWLLELRVSALRLCALRETLPQSHVSLLGTRHLSLYYLTRYSANGQSQKEQDRVPVMGGISLDTLSG